MNIAAILLPQRMVEALGWTLFHALWQGALAALGFAAVLYFSRRYSARLRYGLGLATLALVLLMSGLTFWNHYSGSGPAGSAALARQEAAASASTQPAALTAPAGAPGEGSRSQRIVAFFSDYFSLHLPLIVSLWLLGVLFLTLRFSGSLLYIQRLKYWQNRPLPSPWPGKLQELAARAGLRRPLRLLESLRLKTPVVIGHLKPVLLLPAGLVSGLPADEVEALLAHELAHILRRDYLVNVMQHLVDILFFFHPGLRWISAAVRQEREHCCDDFAVELCGDARHYALALARLQAAGTPQPALAAAGRAHKLLRRIARLLAKPRLVHDFREGFVSALLLVVCLFAMLKLAGAAAPVAAATEIKPKPASAAKSQAAGRFALVSFILEADGLVRLIGKGGVGADASPGTWLVDDSDGQVVWYMVLEGKAKAGAGVSFSEEVPLRRGAYSWYRPAGCKATAQWRRADSKGNWEPLTMFVPKGDRLLRGRGAEDELLRKEEEHLLQERAMAAARNELLEAEQGKRQAELLSRAEAERELQEEQLLQAEELRRREEELLTLNGAEREKKEKELKKQIHEMQAEVRLRQREEELLRAEEIKVRELARQRELEEKGMRLEANRMSALEKSLRAEEGRLRDEEIKFKKFLAELVAAGLVSESEGYEIKLSAAALVINGKKQPAAVHEKIKKSYEALGGQKLDSKRTVTIVHDKD